MNNDGTTACKCPMKCPKKVDYVCGSDGRNYENDCLLRLEACTKKKRLSVKNLGQCGEHCKILLSGNRERFSNDKGFATGRL